MPAYRKAPLSNGNPLEQALIRRWWHETSGAAGRMVWEYYIDGLYVDGVLFPDHSGSGIEEVGKRAPNRFPLAGERVILCEAKRTLNPTVIGQAAVYTRLAIRAGAQVERTLVFAERGTPTMVTIAQELGLQPVIRQLEE